MKKLFLLIVMLAAAAAVPAQEKPITQQEYVRMLYSIERDRTKMPDVTAAVRRRGIDFAVTDGLRSLTKTKAGNDIELRRALDEADRRRKDPEAATLPPAAETTALIAKTRENTLMAVDGMPDFVVKQLIQRSAAYAGTGNFRNLDRLVVAVSYRSSGEEEYRVLSMNGAVQAAPEAKRTYEEVGGTSSTGEFVTMLATIFKEENKTYFEPVDTDLIRGRNAIMFDFEVERDNAKQRITAGGAAPQSTLSGIKGRIWIDREDARVLKIESFATEIPADFPITAARRSIDYEWTAINEEKYLLPTLSDVRLTFKSGKDAFETRNVIRFRDYQKFGTEVIIREEDDAPVNEEQP